MAQTRRKNSHKKQHGKGRASNRGEIWCEIVKGIIRCFSKRNTGKIYAANANGLRLFNPITGKFILASGKNNNNNNNNKTK